jgi:hypothetical protein
MLLYGVNLMMVHCYMPFLCYIWIASVIPRERGSQTRTETRRDNIMSCWNASDSPVESKSKSWIGEHRAHALRNHNREHRQRDWARQSKKRPRLSATFSIPQSHPFVPQIVGLQRTMAPRKSLLGRHNVSCIFARMRENGCSAKRDPHEIIIGMYLKD